MGNTLKIESIPPMPNNPEHPENPPSKIPIPGEQEVVGSQRNFKCKRCGKVFGSKEELDEHMHEAHSKLQNKKIFFL